MAGRLLLADDSVSIHRMAKNALANEGVEILAVTSGDQAEQKLEEFNPDVVVADVFMPGKDGYELCDAIKNNPRFSHVPVLLLVGSFEPFDQVQASRVRADGHLQKPFQPQVFAQAVAHYLNGGAGDAPGTVGYSTPQDYDDI
jgi:CheY-like chemotaxis protein